MTTRTKEHRDYRFWALISPAPDLPGQWISHCLELDIVSQGNDPSDALEMLKDAVQTCVIDDLSDDLDPLEVREKAPDECWEIFYRAISGGESVQKLPSSDASTSYHYIVAMNMRYERVVDHEMPSLDFPVMKRELVSKSPAHC